MLHPGSGLKPPRMFDTGPPRIELLNNKNETAVHRSIVEDDLDASKGARCPDIHMKIYHEDIALSAEDNSHKQKRSDQFWTQIQQNHSQHQQFQTPRGSYWITSYQGKGMGNTSFDDEEASLDSFYVSNDDPSEQWTHDEDVAQVFASPNTLGTLEYWSLAPRRGACTG
ncbi:hypothetical protein PCH_Pc09g00130 [Penicillium rubens Wisconsin 54-1255]|uniref:Uncharacterized protein n=1 Tax=Penicillium rubens (strain ATCC 28089 / DSM 1075 / NRRL 1951 / Wisconsin 54-1255) TaxID=500485 RepID=B6GWK9_PENRW|nr:hypothetical protein PCH_Pc09g00130 [Penicillium rubens Wisconsin 54-1255]